MPAAASSPSAAARRRPSPASAPAADSRPSGIAIDADRGLDLDARGDAERLELAADPLRRPALALRRGRPVEAREVLDGGAQAGEVRLHGVLRVLEYPAAAMAADPDCLFCKIVAGDVPAMRVHEDERTIAFMDINPATRGHLLVIPREHAADVHAIDPEDLKACAVAAKGLAQRCATSSAPTG